MPRHHMFLLFFIFLLLQIVGNTVSLSVGDGVLVDYSSTKQWLLNYFSPFDNCLSTAGLEQLAVEVGDGGVADHNVLFVVADDADMVDVTFHELHSTSTFKFEERTLSTTVRKNPKGFSFFDFVGKRDKGIDPRHLFGSVNQSQILSTHVSRLLRFDNVPVTKFGQQFNFAFRGDLGLTFIRQKRTVQCQDMRIGQTSGFPQFMPWWNPSGVSALIEKETYYGNYWFVGGPTCTITPPGDVTDDYHLECVCADQVISNGNGVAANLTIVFRPVGKSHCAIMASISHTKSRGTSRSNKDQL